MAHELDTSGEVSQFTDAELVCRLERLVKVDRALSAKLLLHLGEVQARKLYCERGYSSMFEYCRTALRMSEAEAYLRICAAGVGRRFPLVLERLGAGAVHLSAIKLLAPHLTVENHVQLLERVQGKSKREVERLVAELAPKPDVAASLRKLPSARSGGELFVGLGSSACSNIAAASASFAPPSASAASSSVAAASSTQGLSPAVQPRARAAFSPLSPGRFKLVLTLGQQAHDALEQLQELLRHQNPSGDLTMIVERALGEFLAKTRKRRFAQTNASERRVTRELVQPKPDAQAEQDVKAKATATASLGKSRYIPRTVLRELYARDAGQCTFVSGNGRRCAARGFLEVHHHDTTFARGGAATVENLRLTCRSHNVFLAERDYGRRFMQEKLREAAVQRGRAGNLFQEREQL